MTGPGRRGTVLVALLLALLVSACVAGEPPAPQDSPAGEPPATRCTDTLEVTDVAGDLLVPEDATCRLVGVAVAGRTIVDTGASLLARSSYFGEGISAHAFRRVEITGGPVPGRAPGWELEHSEDFEKVRDYVFDGGRRLRVTDGDENGAYYVVDMQGPSELRGFYLDLGVILCVDNDPAPRVSRISAETPSKLQGQCAGRRNFGHGLLSPDPVPG